MELLRDLLQAAPFKQATWFTIATLMFFVWIFAKASKDPLNPIKWEHMIVDSDNDRASPYKVGYLIGLIVGTWIVVRMADTNGLTYDVFGMYLTYLLGGAGVNSFTRLKNRRQDDFRSQDYQQNNDRQDEQINVEKKPD